MIDITTYEFTVNLEDINFLVDIPNRFLNLPKDILSKEERKYIQQEVRTYRLKDQITLNHFNLSYNPENPDEIPDYFITDFQFNNDLPDLDYDIEKDPEEQTYILTAKEPVELYFECKTLADTDSDSIEYDINDALGEALNYTAPYFWDDCETSLFIDDSDTQSVYPSDLYDTCPRLYNFWFYVNQKILRDGYHIHTYTDFARRCGGMVLCNEMQNRLFNTLEPWSGDFYASEEDKENGDMYDVYQWYIISDEEFAVHCTNEMIFYDDELNLYVLGVPHWGTSWDLVGPPELHEYTEEPQCDY